MHAVLFLSRRWTICIGRCVLHSEWNVNHDARSSAWVTLNSNGAVQQSCPLADAIQPVTLGLDVLQIEADAPVLNLDTDRPLVLRNAHKHIARHTVAASVCEALLQDA